jgi:periplasmic divalent cation tolerance protein
MRIYLFLSTAGSAREGKIIARRLVEERLAACVSIIPHISSFFFWEGKLGQEKEVLILGKTEARKRNKIVNLIQSMHSYSLPEILFLRVDGGEKRYMQWVAKMTGKKNKKNY